LPDDMTPMPGCYEVGNDNYGNYQYADGVYHVLDTASFTI